MDYLEGETLEAFLARGKRFNPSEAKIVLHQLLSALYVVHQAGLLHRDIKPANILLTSGRCVLVDFGAVTAQHQAVSTRLLSPAYAALEQYSSAALLVPQTDLYALAATILEAITGVLPTSALERANGRPLFEIRIAEIGFVLQSALELQIKARPRNALEMLHRLGLDLEKNVFGPNSRAV
jgi:serine/threonine protein kinase